MEAFSDSNIILSELDVTLNLVYQPEKNQSFNVESCLRC